MQRRARPPRRPARRHEEGWRRGPVLVQVRLDPLLGKPLPCLQRSPGEPPRVPRDPLHPPGPAAAAPDAAPGRRRRLGTEGVGQPGPFPQRRCREGTPAGTVAAMLPVADPRLPGPAAARRGSGRTVPGTRCHRPGQPPPAPSAGLPRRRWRKGGRYGVTVKHGGGGGGKKAIWLISGL